MECDFFQNYISEINVVLIIFYIRLCMYAELNIYEQ